MENSNSYELLSAHYSPDDKKWIVEKLSKLPEKVRRKVATQYSEVYLEAYNNEPINHKKENKARRAANLRLLKYVKRYSSVMSCEVCEPPIVTL